MNAVETLAAVEMKLRAAQDVLAALPRIAGSAFVFTADGGRALGGFTRRKQQFDARCGVSNWTVHDLRRSARSLLSRAGIGADIAERCLGHTIGGVRGVYDRHQYGEEMRHAYEAVAGLIEHIINPKPNVVELRN